MATVNAPAKLTQMNAPTKPAQIRIARRTPAYWRVTIDNPPINHRTSSSAPDGMRASLRSATCRPGGIKALMARGCHKPGNVENRLGYYLGQIANQIEGSR